ncbi:ABC transporter substrate-binding protein [Glaciihabitans sp. dw_435]|uniref:peptide ABC transporter substrate-binding protein n=1 Tax=Glaciihabitans sp. dw_435 TaxID=2720081 RepID=UPI001BD1F48A|nr:ABC transporter substrate-binding protein [Glaciihabitans sp. dw_435]
MKLNRIGVAFAGLGIATALVLTGCSTSGSTTPSATASANATAIITANGSEPANPLIPTNTNETGGGKITDNIFAGLVYYKADGSSANDVADSITTTDAQNYTIKIKSGLKFTNDEPVTSSSFVDAWQYGALLSNKQLNSYFFESIEGFSYDKDSPLTGLKVVDDTTFTVKLKDKEADFPLRLGYTAFMPLPASAFKDMKAFGAAPIGNGPYMLPDAASWEHNVKISLVTNPDYDGPRKPKNGGLTIIFFATEDAAYAEAQGGTLDVLDSVPSAQLANYQTDFPDSFVNQPAAIFQSFTIPANAAHFTGAEGKLRRAAISEAINRDQITKVVFQSTRTPATDFTSPVIDGYSKSLEGSDVLKFNADDAKAKWAEADAISPWTGKFQIAYNADGGHQPWVDAVTNSIKNTLGIDSSGAPYPTFAQFRTVITDRTIKTAFRTGWQADYPALYNFLGPLYGTGAGSNDGDYTSAEFDGLLKQGQAQTDVSKANEFFQQAQELLFKDLPAIPLWYSNVTGVFNKDVSGVQFGWNSVPIYYEMTKA